MDSDTAIVGTTGIVDTTSFAATAAALPDERLEAEVVTWSAHLAAATARWLALVAEYDRRGLWSRWECTSMVAWLSWHCGIDAVTAREHLRVARRLDDLPLVRERFGNGRLSFSKVRALTRIATEATEDDLVQIAESATAAQMARLSGGYRKARRSLDAAGQDTRRGLHVYHDDDGCLVGRFCLPADLGASLMAAVRAAAVDQSPEARVDALVGLVLQQLPPGGQATVLVHVDATDLAGAEPSDAGVVELGGGAATTAEVARRICCDATVLASLDDADGNPLRLGRRRRVVSPALRRALRRRDRHCQFPGCQNSRWLHAHHLRHWAHGGETSIENLVLVCPAHHRAVHEHGWQLMATPHGFRAVAPDPTMRTVRADGDAARVGDLATSVPDPGWYGQRWDLATCVEVLLWTEERHHRARSPQAA